MQVFYFRLIAALLSPEQDDISAMPVYEYLPFVISYGPLLERAAAVLKTTTFNDTIKNYALYDSVLMFLEALSSHALTATLVFDSRPVFDRQQGDLQHLPFLSKKDKKRPGTKPHVKDTAGSMENALAPLVNQATSILRHSRTKVDVLTDAEGSNLVSAATRVDSTSTTLARNKHMFGAKPSAKRKDSAAKLDMVQWHQENSLKEMPDEDILEAFVFKAAAEEAANAVPYPRRMKCLITEIASLKTSLPEGIFVRHGESRLDIMKVLIIGPRGTPYEHGFFEFDLFCPINYPMHPPTMRLTSAKNVRLNPNIYEDGTSKWRDILFFPYACNGMVVMEC